MAQTRTTSELLVVGKIIFFLCCFGLLQSCGGGGSGSSSTPQAQTPENTGTSNPPVAPAPFGLETRPTVANFTIPGETAAVAVDSSAYTVTEAFPNLRFESALFIAGVPGTNQLAVLRQSGQLETFVEDTDSSTSIVALDLSDTVLFSGEQGLLGLAFDPEFITSRFIYLHYSRDAPRRSVISRFTWPANSDQIDRNSEKVILTLEQPFSNHNGGMLAFGPDDYLYIAFGDGGSGGDPANNAQDTTSLLGSLLRIDVHPTDDSEPYAIPDDNPFVADQNFRSEIFAYGLRNPFRFSFDRQTGDLWLGDVGQGAQEEINLIEAGGNYGWRVFEGTERFDDSSNNLPDTAFSPPVITYGRDQGISVIGGYVYRGNLLSGLRGRYFYTDFGTGDIWAARFDGTTITDQVTIGSVTLPSSFGENNNGELYITSLNGGIFNIQTTQQQTNNSLLSATGLFTDLVNLIPAPGLIEYSVNHGFWSDGTTKRRWLSIPENETINFSESQWSFPNGTILVKQFAFGTTQIETRVMQKANDRWTGLSYEWQADGEDAVLLSGRKTVSINGAPYDFPSPTDCFVCHTTASGTVLGLRTEQLNGEHTYDNGITDNQLRSLNNISIFNQDIGNSENFASLPEITGTAPIAERARAYLDVNCAMCHQPGGPTSVSMDLRFEATANGAGLVNQSAETVSEARLIVPGDPANSLILQRMSSLESDRMPPLGSNKLDTTGIAVIRAWINNL